MSLDAVYLRTLLLAGTRFIIWRSGPFYETSEPSVAIPRDSSDFKIEELCFNFSEKTGGYCLAIHLVCQKPDNFPFVCEQGVDHSYTARM